MSRTTAEESTTSTALAAEGSAGAPSWLRSAMRRLGSAAPPLVMLGVILVATALLSPEFFQLQNLINVGRQGSIIGVVAVGMTFVILTAGIDLSVGSTLAIVAVSSAMMIRSGLPLGVVLAVSLALGVGIGIVNGLGVTLLRIQPFVMTLAMLGMVRGATYQISDGAPKDFFVESRFLDFFGNGQIGRVPGPLVIFLTVAAIGWIVLRYLPFGRYVYAIGGSPEAARLSGVRTIRVTIAVYAISGFCAALAGIMTASRLYVGDPVAGNLVELDSIAAVVIGGTSLMGGVGGVAGTVAGAFLLAMLANVLNLIGVSPFYQLIAKGAVIIAAVVLTSLAAWTKARPVARTEGGASQAHGPT